MRIRLPYLPLHINHVLAISMIILLACVGCRRELEEEPVRRNAMIPLNIDWSKSTLLETGGQGINYASVWFFPQDGSKPIITILEGSNHINGDIVYLPIGVYSVLVFNEKVFDPSSDGGTKLNNISFRGTDKWSTFEAFAGVNSKYKSVSDSKTENLDKRIPPEVLAAWSLERFEVTEEMISLTQEMALSNWSGSKSSSFSRASSEIDKLSNITPLPMTHAIYISAKIENLVKAQKIAVTISGAIEGVLLASGKPTHTRIAQPKDILKTDKSWIFDTTNNNNGEVKSSMLVFGLNGENINLLLDFILVNGERMNDCPVFDVSDQVNNSTTPEHIDINVGLEDRKDPNTGVIEDHPITLPDVSGEAVDVGDWNNENVMIK